MVWEKQVSQKEAVKSFFVLTDGKVDLAASVEKYRAAALRYVAGQEAEDTLISECMSSLFELYKGATLNLDFVKSQTVLRMTKVHPELNEPALFTQLSKRVEDYLHANTNQPAVEAKGDKPAQDEITGRIYSMRKGKNGGFYRVADQSESK